MSKGRECGDWALREDCSVGWTSKKASTGSGHKFRHEQPLCAICKLMSRRKVGEPMLHAGVHQASTQDSSFRLEMGWSYLVKECGLPRAIEPQGKPRHLDRKAKQGFYSPDFDDHSSESRKSPTANSAA